MSTNTEKASAPIIGNAIAYFGIEFMTWKYAFEFDDPVVAVAMGGAIVTYALLQIRGIFSFIATAIRRKDDGE